MKLPYRHFEAAPGESADIAESAVVVGRMEAPGRLTLRAYATVRADGEHIRIGHDVYFGEHATSHIVDAKKGTSLGDGVTVARYGVVHGCTLGDRIVVGEGAAVIDYATVGDDAVIGLFGYRTAGGDRSDAGTPPAAHPAVDPVAVQVGTAAVSG